jgi:hypothetical protein
VVSTDTSSVNGDLATVEDAATTALQAFTSRTAPSPAAGTVASPLAHADHAPAPAASCSSAASVGIAASTCCILHKKTAICHYYLDQS